jgi:hypothetical protein
MDKLHYQSGRQRNNWRLCIGRDAQFGELEEIQYQFAGWEGNPVPAYFNLISHKRRRSSIEEYAMRILDRE